MDMTKIIALDKIDQDIVSAIGKGHLEDLLQDMSESKYPFTVDQVKELAEKIGWTPKSYDIGWEFYRRRQLNKEE
jgi:hypothetical protein